MSWNLNLCVVICHTQILSDNISKDKVINRGLWGKNIPKAYLVAYNNLDELDENNNNHMKKQQ